MDFACSTCHGDSGKRIRLQPLPFFSKPEEAQKIVGEWPAYRVSTTHVMTMQHRIYDCFWQMRLPEVELGSEVSVALISYLVKQAEGGEINIPGMKR
jgi:L-cysteine S-thiosulfotransferase